MAQIRVDDGEIEVDAALIARGLGIAAEHVQAAIRNGDITTLCERGEGEDAGSYRLSFFTEHKRLRLVVDENGGIIRRSTIRSPEPLPASFRRPNA